MAIRTVMVTAVVTRSLSESVMAIITIAKIGNELAYVLMSNSTVLMPN